MKPEPFMFAKRPRVVWLPLALFLVFACCRIHADELAPFATDGCSDFPDGTPGQRDLWRHCCVAHDRTYWVGGTYAERLASDYALEQCVAKVGEPTLAKLMMAGVRVGGSPYWPTRFRWGYGWPWMRGYKVLNDEEREQLRRRLAELVVQDRSSDKQQDKLLPLR